MTSAAPWLANARRAAREICDSNLFRVGAALLLGLPVAALAAMGAVVGGAALVGLAGGVASGEIKSDDAIGLGAMAAVFGGVAMAFAGIVLRLLAPSPKLAARPRLRRAILILLAPPLAGLVLMTIILPQLFTLTGLGLVGVCFLGSWPEPAAIST